MPRLLHPSRLPVCPFALAPLEASDGVIATGGHAMPPEISAIAQLGWLTRAKAIASKKSHYEAEDWLAANRAPEQARRIFKAAVGAGSTTDSDLGETHIAIGQWSDSLRTRSVFYRILADNASRACQCTHGSAW
jgi:hypothetical protein